MCRDVSVPEGEQQGRNVTRVEYARGNVTGDEAREVMVWGFCRLHRTFSQFKDFGFFSEQGGISLSTFE